MKKIILSLAFLFSMLIINSCAKDETVSPTENTPKISKWNIKISDMDGSSEVAFDIQYKDNNTSIVEVDLNGQKSKLNYLYENNKLKNIKQNLLDGSEILDINFIYENDKLVKLTKISKGKEIQNTYYTYSGNNLTKVVSTKSIVFNEDTNPTEEADSTTFTDFVDGRPTKMQYRKYYPNNLGVYTSAFDEVYKYENGNLIEVYNEINGELLLKNKYEYNLNKNNIFEQFYFINSMIFNFQFDYIPGNYDKNLITKETGFSLECGDENFDIPTKYAITSFDYTFNSLGNVTKAITNDEIFCKEDEDLSSKYEFTIEW